jgi:hypothetical protein
MLENLFLPAKGDTSSPSPITLKLPTQLGQTPLLGAASGSDSPVSVTKFLGSFFERQPVLVPAVIEQQGA